MPSFRSVRLLAAGAAGLALAACGADVNRFNGEANGNPYRAQSNDVTYSSGPRSAPVAQVESRPLEQPAYNSGGAPVYGPKVYGQNSAPQYQPQPQPQSAPQYQPQPNYQQQGYAPRSVPAAPAPTYRPSADAGSMAHKKVAAAKHGSSHVVASGETLYSLSRRYHVSHEQIAQANGLSPRASLRVGQHLTIPGTAVASNPAPRREAQLQAPKPAATHKVAEATPAPAPLDNAATVKPVAPTEAEPVKTSVTGGAPSFRWPVKGRVISGYGTKPNGQQNDGINISVPENTAVKAAEDGTVAYSGNELKGYGNLVLIRHAGGYVTAYAHNSEVLVHRGEAVKRGQVIAKAGQTGGVASPQVHFEIRKGSNPVDPSRYLTSL